MTTRCMMQAQYFCSGTEPESEFKHYGLASPIYTHFTSPIRRYADVVVHRLLQACIEPDMVYGQELIETTKMKELCDNLNFRNRMAQQAGRSSVELFTSLYFRNKVEVEEGRVLRVLKNGIIVLVPKYGIETIVYTTGGSSPFVYDDEAKSLVAGDVVLKTFDKVKVEITVEGDIDGLRQKMNMKLVEPFVEGVSVVPTVGKRSAEEGDINSSQTSKKSKQ
jgi:exosome complex exonuclease DIS3/RRP44